MTINQGAPMPTTAPPICSICEDMLNPLDPRWAGQMGNTKMTPTEYADMLGPVVADTDMHQRCLDDQLGPKECLDEHKGDCKGPVEFRMSLSGTGTPIPRCDHHWEQRLDEQDRISDRYPDSPLAPSWFDESAIGERWEDD